MTPPIGGSATSLLQDISVVQRLVENVSYLYNCKDTTVIREEKALFAFM